MSSASLITHIPSVDVSGVIALKNRVKKVYSDPDELRKKVDSFLLAYDRHEAELRRKSREKEVDEDGFELVKPSNPTLSVVPTAEAADTRKRKSRAEPSDFYRFQLRERKVAEWSDHQRKMNADKVRITEMKNSDKFQL